MSKVGCPIRRSMDQSLFAAPHGFSQRITSFFACACQGIHQMPLRHFIVLIANAHHLLDLVSLPLSLALKGATKSIIRTNLSLPNQRKGYLLQPRHLMMPSTCSTSLLYWGHAERPACSLVLRPASRDQIRVRAVSKRTSIDRQRCLRPKPKTPTTTDQSDKLPSSHSSSTRSDRLGHPWFQQN